jgi:hydroxymethylpyrimidine/phosphomethylpyrimidine kinase
LSDIKTLEAHGVYGCAAITGLTFQNEREIRRVEWLGLEKIVEQIDLCFASAAFDWVKIGITPSMGMAGAIIDHIRQHNPGVRVVLDPVIRASSGQAFWGDLTAEWEALTAEWEALAAEWEALAARCYLITPNWEEIGWLFPGEDIEVRCAAMTKEGERHIYLKGGHNREHPGRDYLWSDGEVEVLDAVDGGREITPKHGSGCVLSSALTANLALGFPLPIAAERAKRYIERFLSSNKTLLGWH